MTVLTLITLGENIVPVKNILKDRISINFSEDLNCNFGIVNKALQLTRIVYR